MFFRSLGFVAVLFIAFFAIFVPAFGTNDDVIIMMISSGFGLNAFSPDEHLLFINVVIGLVLKALYNLAPGRPWYGSFLLLVHFLSILALLYSLQRKRFSPLRLLFFALFFFIVEIYFLISLTFTTTAFFAGMSGIFLFISALERSTLSAKVSFGFAFFMLVLSFMIRVHSFQLIIAISIPILVLTFIVNRHNSAVLVRFIAFFIVLVVFYVGLVQYNNNYYKSNPAWDGFFEDNYIRYQIKDYRRLDFQDDSGRRKLGEILDKIGWSPNDYSMVVKWNDTYDKTGDTFSTANMEKLLLLMEADAHIDFSKFVPFIRRHNSAFKWFIGAFVALIALFILFTPRDRRFFAYFLVAILGFVALICYLILYLKLIDRVYFPLLGFIVFLVLFHTQSWKDDRSHMERVPSGVAGKALLILFSAGVLISFVLLFRIYLNTNRSVTGRKLQFRESIKRLNSGPDSLFVVWGSSMPIEYILPLEDTGYLSGMKIISTGYSFRMPLARKLLSQFDITDINRALFERDDVFMISSNNKMLNYQLYHWEHFRKELRVRLLRTFPSNKDGRFSVYKLSR